MRGGCFELRAEQYQSPRIDVRRYVAASQDVAACAADEYYETLAICRSLAAARAVFAVAIAEKPAGRFMIRSRTRVVQRHPKGDW
jgi:hypothetical protein